MRISCPFGVCATSGWNCTAYRPRPSSSNAAIGVVGDEAVTRAPVGGAVTESRWLIQTVCSAGSSWKSGDGSDLGLGLPVFAHVVRLDGAAEVTRHQLHAVADAEGRHAEVEDPGVHVRRPWAYTEAGPPERMSASGFRARTCSALTVGDELGVDARLANPARDQLAVLAAEVEDEHRALLRRLASGNWTTSALTAAGSWASPW